MHLNRKNLNKYFRLIKYKNIYICSWIIHLFFFYHQQSVYQLVLFVSSS